MKRCVSLVLILIILLSSIGIGFANNEVNEVVHTSPEEVYVNKTFPWRTVLKYSYKIADYYKNKFINRKPTTNFGINRDTISSGTINFNNKYKSGYGAFVKKDIRATRGGHEIEMWANSGALFWTGKIGVSLKDKNGNYRINRTVGHNQYSWYKVPSWNTGSYVAEYSTTEKASWNLWVGYCHYSRGGGGRERPLPQFEKQGNITGSIVNGNVLEDIKFKDIGNKRYILPSNSHMNSKSNKMNKVGRSYYSFSQLHEQFYDYSLGIYVDVAKDFSVGDTILISDDIVSLEYNEVKDETKFGFKFKDEKVDYIHFSGNLTNEYDVGDNIKFQFKLLPVAENEIFVVLDYNKIFEETGETPDIKQFLSK